MAACPQKKALRCHTTIEKELRYAARGDDLYPMREPLHPAPEKAGSSEYMSAVFRAGSGVRHSRAEAPEEAREDCQRNNPRSSGKVVPQETIERLDFSEKPTNGSLTAGVCEASPCAQQR